MCYWRDFAFIPLMRRAYLVYCGFYSGQVIENGSWVEKKQKHFKIQVRTDPKPATDCGYLIGKYA